MKLKQGSRLDLNLTHLGSTKTDINQAVTSIPPDGEEEMTLDADCSSVTSSTLSDRQSIGHPKQATEQECLCSLPLF